MCTNGSNVNFHSTGNAMCKAHDHTLFKQGNMVSIGCILDPPPHAQGQNTLAHAGCVEHPDGSYQILPPSGRPVASMSELRLYWVFKSW